MKCKDCEWFYFDKDEGKHGQYRCSGGGSDTVKYYKNHADYITKTESNKNHNCEGFLQFGHKYEYDLSKQVE